MASNTIIPYTSSSHAIKTNEYDVFVSFRGEDTRNNFIGFLFEALRRKGIDVFKDDQHLKKGESIAPELCQAIQGSRLFVVVFSKNYASSTWCLRELVEICKCVETSPRQILPIFYDVDPSEVRKQSGCYEKAFTEHEERCREDKEKMEEVRTTLTKVADFSGWDIGNKVEKDLVVRANQPTNTIGNHISYYSSIAVYSKNNRWRVNWSKQVAAKRVLRFCLMCDFGFIKDNVFLFGRGDFEIED